MELIQTQSSELTSHETAYDVYTSSLLRENLVEIPNFALHYSDKGKISVNAMTIGNVNPSTSLIFYIKHNLVTSLTFIYRWH